MVLGLLLTIYINSIYIYNISANDISHVFTEVPLIKETNLQHTNSTEDHPKNYQVVVILGGVDPAVLGVDSVVVEVA
jgi:hypothetical protein